MRSEYQRLHDRLIDLKANLVFSIFPPNYELRGTAGFYHTMSREGDKATNAFILGVAEQMDAKGQINVTKWPYLRDRRNPLRILPAVHRQAKEIPEEYREYLPSRQFAECLLALPAPLQSLKLPESSTKCLVGVPPVGRPRGVLVYCESPDFRKLPQLIDNLYFLAARGYVVFAPRFGKSPREDVSATLSFLRAAKIFDRIPLVMLGVGAAGTPMWDTLSLDRQITPRGVAVADFEPGDSLDETKLPVGSGMKSPVMFIYDETPLTSVSTSAEAQTSLSKIGKVKAFTDICKGRSQFARISLIPPETETPGKVAQAAVETAEDFLTKVVENRTNQIAP